MLFSCCCLSDLGLTCHIGKLSLVAYLENLPINQALKIGVAPIHQAV